MKPTSKRLLFGAAILVGMSLVLAQPLYRKLMRPPPVHITQLYDNVSVSEQLKPQDMPGLSERGFIAIIDLRPDGEAADQTPSTVMETAARAGQMDFVYVPVAHGAIPDSAVAALDKALQAYRSPVLLYCRSGKRAARTWALVEASRAGGMTAQAILETVKAGGQSADDLSEDIARRIAKRPSTVVAVQQ